VAVNKACPRYDSGNEYEQCIDKYKEREQSCIECDGACHGIADLVSSPAKGARHTGSKTGAHPLQVLLAGRHNRRPVFVL